MAIHATQLRPCSAYVFAGQTHTLAPSNDDIPAGQGTHVLDPVTLEYEPARQFIQTLTLLARATTEYVPATQFVHTLCAPSEYAPAEQLKHTLTLVAPVTPE